jgi:hypothetical protein
MAMMNWQELAGPLIKLGAPTIGTALGGPLGGMVGNVVGNILGSALGVPPTPEAVGNAINSIPAPELHDKLAAADADAQAQYPELAKADIEARAQNATETQLTMRAELAAGDPLQRWWRPIYALELTLECAVVWSIAIYDLLAGDGRIATLLAQNATLLMTYWGARFAVLGVYVNGRTREKTATITGQIVPTIIEQLAKARPILRRTS